MMDKEDMAGTACVVGVDFDNTIVSYEKALRGCVESLGLDVPSSALCKRSIRDYVRQMPDGELTWQRMQAHIYGPGMADAELMPGVRSFFDICRERGVPVHVVSHKSEYAAAGPDGPNLRDTALSWMSEQGLLDEGTGVSRDHIWFESTRVEKIERIGLLGCTHFVDDLEETFLEETFPSGVVKLLFAPGETASGREEWLRFFSWDAICAYFAEDCWRG